MEGTPDRERLAQDIQTRGLLQPLIVWNHASSSRRPGPRPWYLKIGYNKLWALKRLGSTTAPAIVASDAPMQAEELRTSGDILKYWHDGTFVWGNSGPTCKSTQRLEYYFRGEPKLSRAKYLDRLPSVKWANNVPFKVWYVEQFPLERLRYRDLHEKDPGGRAWRAALVEDIRARGICGGPLLVYNHQHMDPELRDVINKPYYLRVGRNRRWALRELGYTYAPCVVTGVIDENMQGRELDADGLRAVITDGDWEVTKQGIFVRGKADASAFEYPR